jgi:N-acetylneuraminate synthase
VKGEIFIFIAEIGINHNGDINYAKKLIDMAKKVGADIVKFQKRDVELCVPNTCANNIKETPWGNMKYIDYKRKIEFSKEDYDEINKYCEEIGIKWTASVWDENSLEFLLDYEVPFIKIPSACITDLKLLNCVKKSNKSVVISTGMSTEEEIDTAISILGNSIVSILHCNSSYPAKGEELNLNVIKTLALKYPTYEIGYSGHEKDILPTIIAYAMGAEVIERHITLDKKMWGTDQQSSLDENQLINLMQSLNLVKSYRGSGEFTVYDSEKEVMKKLRKNK